MHNSLTMQKIGQHAWPVQALLLCSVLVCSQVQTASASGNSVTASTPRALQNHRMVDYSAHNDNFEVSSDSMLHDTDDEQLLVKWATGTPTIQIREGYTGTESVADAILSRKLRQDEVGAFHTGYMVSSIRGKRFHYHIYQNMCTRLFCIEQSRVENHIYS